MAERAWLGLHGSLHWNEEFRPCHSIMKLESLDRDAVGDDDDAGGGSFEFSSFGCWTL